MDKKKLAFTLAEVLITLGVIGVVAAITIPTLVQNHRNHIVETKLKQTYSLVNQALTMSEAINGEKENWVNELNTKEGIEKYITPYLKTIKIIEKTNRIYLYLSNGVVLGKNTGYAGDWFVLTSGNCSDVTSNKGICKFIFYYYPKATDSFHASQKTKQFEPYDYQWDNNINSLKYNKTFSCYNGDRNYCTKLIQYNNWKIPDDYPYRVK